MVDAPFASRNRRAIPIKPEHSRAYNQRSSDLACRGFSDSLRQIQFSAKEFVALDCMLVPKPYLREISLKREKVLDGTKYPFTIPAVRHLDVLRFDPDMTFS